MLANVLACEPGEPAGCAPETTTNPVPPPRAHQDLRRDGRQQAGRHGHLHGHRDQRRHRRLDGDRPGHGGRRPDRRARRRDVRRTTRPPSAGADPTYAAPRLTWTGALAHGDTVTITYTVDPQGRRRRRRRQRGLAAGSGRPRPDAGLRDLAAARAPSTSFDLPKLTIKKTSNRAQLPAAGQKITYTVTVTNPGPGDYTAAHPATFTDDLADVLDDATFDAGSITATVGQRVASTAPTLDWSGVLAAGAVGHGHLHADLPGDRQPRAWTTPPASRSTEAKDPADACRTVHTPGLGAAARQVGRPGQRDVGRRGPGAHLHADLRERRPGRRDGRHLRRPVRRRSTTRCSTPARSPPTPGSTATPNGAATGSTSPARSRPARP